MSELAGWQDDNARYLGAALAWLRARLERRVSEQSGRSQPDVVEERLAAHAAALQSAEARMNFPPALMMLGQRLGLSWFEQQILLLCAAMELDTGTAALCARAQGDPGRPYPTFALALGLLEDATWDALSPERPLRYWRLIEINQPGGQPLTSSALRADERIVNYLKGLNYLDDRLEPLLTPLEIPRPEETLPDSQRNIADAVLNRIAQTPAGRQAPIVQLLGVDTPSKRLVAVHVAAALGRRVFRLPLALIPSQPGELETFVRLWQRESVLLPLALYLETHDGESDDRHAGRGASLNRLLARSSGVLFLDTRETWTSLSENTIVVDVEKPTRAEQQSAWTKALGDAGGGSAALLACQFDLNLGAIQRIADDALAGSAVQGGSHDERVWEACLAATRPQLGTLAQRLEAKATWDDLVLPRAECDLLRQIAAQVAHRARVYEDWGFGRKMSRGFGISALFAGDSGTGKTMAAEVIANELRLNLYRIDLSAVVSKYIGETEKNLCRLFDAAEAGGAVLFFDEADALFGKRSEVKDSHDRYANIEINYLLQRMESYRGLAILATNMKSALDSAFMRRLRFVVNFPFPGVVERRVIWRKAFPAETETRELDFERLAGLNLTGGNIHSIALNAAFLAAESGGPVTMPLILSAAHTELRKLGRTTNELEFRWQRPAGVVA